MFTYSLFLAIAVLIPHMSSNKKNSSIVQTNDAAPLNPVTKEFEWGGPIGGLFMSLSLPFVVLGLNSVCSASTCSLSAATDMVQLAVTEVENALPAVPTALGIEVAWLVFHSLFYLAPVGRRVSGQPLRNGKTLTYNMNAIHAFAFCHVAAVLLHVADVIDLAFLADLFVPLMLGAIIISTVMSVALYLMSFRSSQVLLAAGGNSGNPLYDFWIGRELNPRIGQLDLKFMCELRPGLIGWSLLNWSFVVKAHSTGVLTPAIVLVAIFESWYVADGLFIEEGNLTMMDIVYDGFGFMLCFGDLAWVPFIYTLKCKFLAYHPQHLPNSYLLLCVAMNLLGYMIFRGANSEKDKFRKNPRDPQVAHLKVMKTSAGKSLIISGYWGICRHPNYVGDWLMTTSWSALTGTGHILPFFQSVYFAILLIHRQLRDEHQMLHKYGEEDWKRFCNEVKYRLIPYIY